MQIITCPGQGSAEGGIAEPTLDGVSSSEGTESNTIWTTCVNEVSAISYIQCHVTKSDPIQLQYYASSGTFKNDIYRKLETVWFMFS